MKTKEYFAYKTMMEEYRAIRHEVTEAIKIRTQIIAFGTAALGFVTAGSIRLTEQSCLEVVWVVTILTVTLNTAFISYYYAASKRVRRASWHLFKLEDAINDLLGVIALTWEVKLRTAYPKGDENYGKYPLFGNYHLIAVQIFFITSFIPLYFLIKKYYVSDSILCWFILIASIIDLITCGILRLRIRKLDGSCKLRPGQPSTP